MQAALREQYHERLQQMRSEILGKFNRLRDSTAEDVAAPGDLSRVPTHNADRDTEGLEAQKGIEKVEGVILNQVDAAMRRLEEDTYGTCVRCAEEIGSQRLDAVPYASTCASCAE